MDLNQANSGQAAASNTSAASAPVVDVAQQAFSDAGLTGGAPVTASAEVPVSPAGGESPGLTPPGLQGDATPAGGNNQAAAAAAVPFDVARELGYSDSKALANDFQHAVRLVQQGQQEKQQFQQWAGQANAELQSLRAQVAQFTQQHQVQQSTPKAVPDFNTMVGGDWKQLLQADPREFFFRVNRAQLEHDPQYREKLLGTVKSEMDPRLQKFDQFTQNYQQNYNQYTQQQQQEMAQQQQAQAFNHSFAQFVAAQPAYAEGSEANKALRGHYQANQQQYHALHVAGTNPFAFFAPMVAQQKVAAAQAQAAEARMAQTSGLRVAARPGAAATLPGTGVKGAEGVRAIFAKATGNPSAADHVIEAFSDAGLR